MVSIYSLGVLMHQHWLWDHTGDFLSCLFLKKTTLHHPPEIASPCQLHLAWDMWAAALAELLSWLNKVSRRCWLQHRYCPRWGPPLLPGFANFVSSWHSSLTQHWNISGIRKGHATAPNANRMNKEVLERWERRRFFCSCFCLFACLLDFHLIFL